MTDQHVPVEHLAAYAAGDLDATAALEVEAHVLLCTACRADADAVTRATAALASLPPVTMPADVAARVDAALAGADEQAGPVGDLLPLAPKRGRLSWPGLAAIAAGLALVVAIGFPLVTRDRGNVPTTVADAARENAADTRRLDSGLNYTHDTLAATLTAAIGGRRAAAEDTAGYVASPGTTVTTSKGDDEGTMAPTAPRAETVKGTAFALSTDPGRLASCIAAIAEAQETPVGKVPLLVDFARFDGKDALVLVFPTESRGAVLPDRVDLWVVGPRCGIVAGDDDVLDFARFARPSGL